MDDKVFREAQKYADERHPPPPDTPAAAAARTAILTFLLLLFFDRLELWLGFPIAFVAALATATAVVFLDTRQRWSNHSKAIKEAVQRLERDQRR